MAVNKRIAKKKAKAVKVQEVAKAAEIKEEVKVEEAVAAPVEEVETVVEAPVEVVETVVEAPVEAEAVTEEKATEAPAKEEVTEKKPRARRTTKAKDETAQEKKPAVKRTTKKAVKANIVVQSCGREISMEDAIEKATEDWCKSGNDRADLKEIAVYVKPEESAIFYVINGKATGRVAF